METKGERREKKRYKRQHGMRIKGRSTVTQNVERKYRRKKRK